MRSPPASTSDARVNGLPAWIGAVLDRNLENVSRAALREAALAASQGYRAGGGSAVIRSGLDALAYAVVRMPATYAAADAALSQAARAIPDFAPRSLLDLGAGPGTAAWAAAAVWPSLTHAALIDRNAHLLALARQFGAEAPLDAAIRQADIADALTAGPGADVVIASYTLAELAPAALAAAVGRLWTAAARLVVLVEPGTTDGFKRILACRDILLGQGAAIVAPCSHEQACPLAAAPRWCHFGVRLPRSRAHRLSKGASLAYEDEKFSYLAAGKGFDRLARGERILATPKVGKAGVALTLCRPAAAEQRMVPRRQVQAYKVAKALGWGDAISGDLGAPKR